MPNRENPFPGINPWMQRSWSDVHTMLIGYIRDALAVELPGDLIARAEEHVVLTAPPDGERVRAADVAVIENEPWKRGERPVWTPEGDSELAGRLAEPVIVDIGNVKSRWVEIRTVDGNLVTVIEVVSPANKTRSGREEFEKKIHGFIQAGVNVVEIDLIRGGRSARDIRGGFWPEDPCQIIAMRPDRWPCVEVYPCPLREALPAVRVPLRPNEPDAALDLQPLIDRCHTLGGYWSANYREKPNPPLSDEDDDWAMTRLKDAELL